MTMVMDAYARALAALHAGDRPEAARHALAALTIDPDHGLSSLVRGVALPQEDVLLRLAHMGAACRDGARDAEAWYNLGVTLDELGLGERAVDCYRRAICLDATHAGALANGALALRIHEHFLEAAKMARRLQRLRPDDCVGYLHEAIALQHLERLDEADWLFGEAMRRMSNTDHPRWEQHHSQLARHQFKLAWESYEVRFSASVHNGVDPFPFEHPQWSGKPDQHVLVYGEQGLGDQIMFASAIADLQRRSVRVSIAVSIYLVPLFAASFPGVIVRPLNFKADAEQCSQLVADIGRTQPVDAVIAIGSLMQWFRNQRSDFTGKPYLHASDDARLWWQSKAPEIFPSAAMPAQRAGDKSRLGKSLRSKSRARRAAPLRIGLCWASNPAPDRFNSALRATHKTMPLEVMAPLAEIDGVEAVAVTNVPLHAFGPSASARRNIADVSADLIDMDRTAAMIESLDVVITVDTGIAHLAGALGKPVWILLFRRGDSRWGQRGDATSYWYDSARLYWQDQLDDWAPVIARVKSDLTALIAGRDATATQRATAGQEQAA